MYDTSWCLRLVVRFCASWFDVSPITLLPFCSTIHITAVVRRSRPLSGISNRLNAECKLSCYHFISVRVHRAREDQLPFYSLSGIANTCQVPSVLSTMHCGVSRYPAPLKAASVGFVVMAFRWRGNNPDIWRDDPSRVLPLL